MSKQQDIIDAVKVVTSLNRVGVARKMRRQWFMLSAFTLFVWTTLVALTMMKEGHLMFYFLFGLLGGMSMHHAVTGLLRANKYMKDEYIRHADIVNTVHKRLDKAKEVNK